MLHLSPISFFPTNHLQHPFRRLLRLLIRKLITAAMDLYIYRNLSKQTKIDKTNPLFDIKTDAKIWSNQNVTIKANVNENGCIIQYQIDNGSWQQYSKNVIVP